MSGLTVLEVLRRTEGFLRERGSLSARLDAELLMARTLDVDRVGVYLAHDRPMTDDETVSMRGLVRRRGKGLPVAYLLGSKEFYGIDLQVDARVLVPRPETEGVVDRALELLEDRPADVVDVGTGCGAIACALACEHAQVQVLATEIDPQALEVAKANITRTVPDGRVTVVQADLLGPAQPSSQDMIVSNPPYVAEGDPSLHPNVASHEPAIALYGGQDGLAIYRRLAPAAARALKPGGWLVLELGQGQADAVTELVEHAGLGRVDVRSDLAGIPRVLSAQRAEQESRC